MADDNALPEDGLTDEQMDQMASSQGSSPQANQAVPEDGLTDEQMDQLSAGQPESSAMGAAGRSFVRGILPNTAAALAGNVAGVGAGLAALPETGPAAPFIGGAAAAAVAGGVGYVATRAQDAIAKQLGMDLGPQEQADVTQHPYASEFGDWASLLATFNLGGIETKLAQRAITGGIMGGIDLTQQAANKGVGNIDPTEAAIAVGGGALLGGTRSWARGSERIGTQLGEAFRRNPIRTTVGEGGVAGRPNQPQQPDAVDLRMETNKNDLTMVSRGVAQENIAPTHQPDTVQPEKDPSATIDVVRSDTDYKKGKGLWLAPTEGVEGAPSTPGITFDDAPAADIQAALGMQQGAQGQPTAPNVPSRAPPQAPIETGLAALNPARQMLWQRRLPPKPAAAQGQLGLDFQPEPTPAQLPGGNMRDVQIIRHGATDLNHDDLSVDKLRGWTNVPLSEAGRAEATKTSEDVAKSPPGHIITSDLDRAHETAKIVSAHTGVPIVGVTPNLRPWNVGDLAGKPSKDGIPILADYATNHPNTPVPGGESFNQFRSRFFTGLDNILDHSPNKPAIVIHHRGERLMKSWADAGYPADGSIDMNTFNQKGEPTGKAEDLQLPPDRVKAAAQALREQAAQPEAGVQPIAKAPPEGQTAVETTPREQQILDSLKNLEGGEEAAGVLEKTTGAQREAAFAKAAQAVKNAPEKRAKVGEVQTGGGARGARKTAAAAAVKDAYEKFAPAADEDDQALLDRLKGAVDHATDQYGGKNPVDRKEGYAPRVKPPEWQFIKKAQAVLAKPTDANIEQFRTDEGLLRSGGAADVQATKRITADIEKRGTPTAETAEAAGAAESTGLPARQDFDLMEPWKPGADESKQYIDQSNDLRTWINGLDEGDYNKLAGAYPDIKEVVETAGDPNRLRLQMESDLEGAQMKAAAPVSPKPPASTVTEKPLTTEPGAAASQGVSRKDLIAEYNAKLKAGQLPGGNITTPEERMPQMNFAGNKPAAEPQPEPETQALTRGKMPKNLEEATDKTEAAIGKQAQTLAEANGLVEPGKGAGGPPKPPEPPVPPASPSPPEKNPGAAVVQRRSALARFIKPDGDNWFNRILNPEAVSPEAMKTGNILRSETGKMALFSSTAEHDLTDAYKLLNKASPEAKWDFINKFETGKVPYNNELAPAADGMRTVLDRYGDMVKTLPQADRVNFLENYLPHVGIWDHDSIPIIQKLAQNWITQQGSAASLLKRTYYTIRDGLQSGAKLDPKFIGPDGAPDIGKIMSTYQTGIEGFALTQKALGRLIDDGLAYVKAPAAEDKLPPGLELLKGRTYRGMGVYATPDIARVYNNRFSPGIKGNPDAAALFQNWMHFKANLNAVSLFGGAYHLGAVAPERAIASVGQGIAEMASGDMAGGLKTIMKAPGTPLTSLSDYKRIMLEARSQGRGNPAADTVLGKAVQDLTNAGFQWDRVLREQPDLETTAFGSYWRAYRTGDLANELAQSKKAFGQGIGPGTKETFKIVGRAMEAFMHPLFEMYIPALKASAAVQQYSSYLMHVPDATPELRAQAARRITDQIDNSLGTVVNSNVFWNPVLKQALQGTMVSWGWNMGTARYLGGGALKAARSPGSISMHNQDFDPRTAALIAFPIVTGAISAIYELLKTGTMPQDLRDFITPRTGGTARGMPERAILPGYQKDILGAYNNFAGSGKASQEAYNKLALAPRLAYETMANQDWSGHAIWNPNHPLSQKIIEYFQHVGQSLLPISAQQISKPHAGSALTTGERGAGIRQAPSFITRPQAVTSAYRKANEKAWKSKQKFDQYMNR